MTSFLDRLFGRPEPPKAGLKAVTALGPWATGIPLSSYARTPQDKATAYLKAYKVGWFYKAGKKIADDISTLDWSVSLGDVEEGDAESTLDRPQLSIEFDALSPIDQFQRLLERPNPRDKTGRALLRKTQVRLDFAGAAAWYLEGGDGGLPSAIYGISPARMWPSYDKGGNLIGWVMDRDRTDGGVPFSVDEILWFSTGNAEDDDLFGTSVVEAVYSQVPLTDLMNRHTANVLTTGGRMAGMLAPKDRALSEDEFVDAQRAWRNVTSDPDAAKRLLIFPEPMEYTPGASTPAEIGIPELATLTRDEIITAFPVSPEMLGVPMPSGLNASGESRRELRRFYQEDTIHPRADLIEETVQVGLLSRYEAVMGQTYDFEIEEPNLDDAPSIIEKVGAYKGLVSVGFDPKEAVSAVGLESIKWLGLPAILDPAKQLQMQEAAAEANAQAKPEGGVTVAAGDTTRRDAANTQVSIAKSTKAPADGTVDEAKAEISRFLTEQRERITAKIEETFSPKTKTRKAEVGHWWDSEAEDAALRETLRTLYLKIGRQSLQVVADDMGRVVLSSHVKSILADLLSYGGKRITNINEATRDAVTAQLTEGVRRGYSINQIVDGVASESYGGVSGAVLDNGTPVFDPYRAEVIGRTETMLSYNRAAITGYGQFGVREVQAIDGDGDAECAARNGHTYSIEEAYGIEDHPNGTLDWIPVLDKAAHEPMTVAPVTNVHISLPETKIANEAPVINVTNDVPTPYVVNEVLTPSVTVTNDVKTPDVQVINEVLTPNVKVAAPQVTVNNEVVTPEVHVTNEVQTPDVTVTNEVVSPSVHVTNEVPVPEVHVTTPEVTVNVPKQPKRVIERDERGQIVSITDGS